ncbi:hypothetical protein GDO81_008506 [Engystomops pustulosus]|uniref:Uncharacterized protein n=1 Tax=Engystomops pustulosus TaxID=76066 RepID=A0AAV7CG25_ENGPU|nr:hypothetical protein GDO81_008506 [Engystomops pustulosus]
MKVQQQKDPSSYSYEDVEFITSNACKKHLICCTGPIFLEQHREGEGGRWLQAESIQLACHLPTAWKE